MDTVSIIRRMITGNPWSAGSLPLAWVWDAVGTTAQFQSQRQLLSYLVQQEDVVVFEQPKRNAIHHKDFHKSIRLKSNIPWRQADEARWFIEDYYEAVLVLLGMQSVEQGYQPAKSIGQILGELPVLYRQYMECGNGNAEVIRMAAMIRSSNCMPARRGDIWRLLSRHGRFRMQQTGGTVLIGVT